LQQEEQEEEDEATKNPEVEEIPSADTTEEEEEEEEADKKNAKAKNDISTRSGVIAPQARECATKESPDKVAFECRSVTQNVDGEVKDKLKFKVGASKGDFLKITVEYDTKWETTANDTEVTETQSKTQYTLVYDRLIEYRKVGSAEDQHYEWGVDEVVAEWPMNNWDELSAVQSNGDLLTFSATVGVATFDFTIAQTDSEDLTTNKMKIDFLLENYPWAETGDTFVALISHIETERKTKTETAGPGSDQVSDVLIDFEDAVETVGFIPFGEYTWASTAEATVSTPDFEDLNGTDVMMARSGNFSDAVTTTISVVASTSTSTTTEGGQEIAFSFVGAGQGADRIFWDPEAGIGYASSAARIVGSLVLLVCSMGIALIL